MKKFLTAVSVLVLMATGVIAMVWTNIAPYDVAITASSGTARYATIAGHADLLTADNTEPLPPAISADAGANQVKYMPDNSVSLSASGSTGKIKGYAWSKISGPSEGSITKPASAGTIVSNLAVGTYVFRVSVTNGSTTVTDNVTVTVCQQKSPACAKGAPVRYNLKATGTEMKYLTPYKSFPALKGGDTLAIPSGDYTLIHFIGITGDSCRPIVIINRGGQVKCRKGQVRLWDCRFVKFTGTGVPGIEYGFRFTDIPQMVVSFQSSDWKIDHVQFSGGGNAVFAKMQVDLSDALSYHPNWSFGRCEISNIKVDSTAGEALYIGHTLSPSPCNTGNLMPVNYRNMSIHDNLINYTGWDGIQISLGGDSCLIYNNLITNYGWKNRPAQKNGIVFGGYTTGRIWNNTLKRGTGAAIAVFGYGRIKVYYNEMDSAGIWAGNPVPLGGKDYNASALAYAPDPAIYCNGNISTCLSAYPIAPLAVSVTDNCIKNISSYALGAAIRNNNRGGTTRPGVITRNAILDRQRRSLSAIIISNAGDAVRANTLGSCSGSKRRK